MKNNLVKNIKKPTTPIVGCFFSCALLFGCVKTAWAKKDYPEWYTSKPKDNILYLYSVGTGVNSAEAIQNALLDVSKRLLKEFNDNFFVDERAENLKEPIFSSFSIEAEERDKGESIVLISLKRNEIFEAQLNHFRDIDKTISTKYEFINDKNVFSKLEIYKDILKLVEEAKEKLLLLKNINKFDGTEYLARYGVIEDEYSRLKDAIDINIIAVDEFSKKILPLVMDYCSQKNIQIKEDSKNILLLESSVKSENIYNNFVVNVSFNFKMKYNGNIINYNTVNVTGNSKKSFEESQNIIVEDFKQNINSYNIIY